MKATFTLLAGAALALACALPASSQAAPHIVVVAESFDDVSALPGWAVANHSSPTGLPWFQGNAGVFSAHQGAPSSYIAANFLSAQNASGIVDNWLFTPQLSLSGTSVLSFFTRADPLPGFGDTLEIRFSPHGASTAPGDFTVLLGTIGGGTGFPFNWQQFSNSIDFDGVGRFAFRYLGAADALNYIGLDTVTITTVPEPAAGWMLVAGLFALALQRRHFLEYKS